MDIEYEELAFQEYSSDIIYELYSLEDIRSVLPDSWSDFIDLVSMEDNDYEESISSFLEWYEDDTSVLDELVTKDKRHLIQKHIDTGDGYTMILEVKPMIVYMKEK